jgi:hypothetical protein
MATEEFEAADAPARDVAERLRALTERSGR